MKMKWNRTMQEMKGNSVVVILRETVVMKVQKRTVRTRLSSSGLTILSAMPMVAVMSLSIPHWMMAETSAAMKMVGTVRTDCQRLL
jgi:hypothetical protein